MILFLSAEEGSYDFYHLCPRNLRISAKELADGGYDLRSVVLAGSSLVSYVSSRESSGGAISSSSVTVTVTSWVSMSVPLGGLHGDHVGIVTVGVVWHLVVGGAHESEHPRH